MIIDEVTDGILSDALETDKPIVLDFYGEWCGPCKVLSANLDAIDKKMGDEVTIIKADIEECLEAATSFSIRTVPTLLLIKEGQVAATRTGAASSAELEKWLVDNS